MQSQFTPEQQLNHTVATTFSEPFQCDLERILIEAKALLDQKTELKMSDEPAKFLTKLLNEAKLAKPLASSQGRTVIQSNKLIKLIQCYLRPDIQNYFEKLKASASLNEITKITPPSVLLLKESRKRKKHSSPSYPEKERKEHAGAKTSFVSHAMSAITGTVVLDSGKIVSFKAETKPNEWGSNYDKIKPYTDRYLNFTLTPDFTEKKDQPIDSMGPGSLLVQELEAGMKAGKYIVNQVQFTCDLRAVLNASRRINSNIRLAGEDSSAFACGGDAFFPSTPFMLYDDRTKHPHYFRYNYLIEGVGTRTDLPTPPKTAIIYSNEDLGYGTGLGSRHFYGYLRPEYVSGDKIYAYMVPYVAAYYDKNADRDLEIDAGIMRVIKEEHPVLPRSIPAINELYLRVVSLSVADEENKFIQSEIEKSSPPKTSSSEPDPSKSLTTKEEPADVKPVEKTLPPSPVELINDPERTARRVVLTSYAPFAKLGFFQIRKLEQNQPTEAVASKEKPIPTLY